MDLSKIITGLLSKAYKLDDGEIAELLKDGENITEDTVLGILLQKDSDRVKAIKTANDTEGKFQEGYKKAKKEERSAFEKELKEKLNITSELTGVELVESIITTKAAETGTGGKGKEVTDDDVKKHPVYQTLESKYKTDLKAKDTEWETKIADLQNGYKKQDTFATVKSKALTLLDGLKPILPGKAEVAANQKGLFVSLLKDNEYDIQGDRIVVMKDGKVVEDNHGNSLTFEELVKSQAAKFFEFQKNNGGGNSGGGNNGGGGQGGAGGYPAGITKPKTFEEMTKITDDQSIKLEDRLKVIEVWEQENTPT